MPNKLRYQKRIPEGPICYLDTAWFITASAISPTNCNTIVNSVAAGAGPTNFRRLGPDVTIIGWKLQYYWTAAANSTNVKSQLTKVWVYWDENPLGAVPPAAAFESNPPFGFPPKAYRNRLKIIRCIKWVAPDCKIDANGNRTAYWDSEQKYSGQRMQLSGHLNAVSSYDDASGTPSFPNVGALGVATSQAVGGLKFWATMRVLYKNSRVSENPAF